MYITTGMAYFSMYLMPMDGAIVDRAMPRVRVANLSTADVQRSAGETLGPRPAPRYTAEGDTSKAFHSGTSNASASL